MEIIMILGWAFGSAIIIALHLNRLDKRIDEQIREISHIYQRLQELTKGVNQIDDELDNINNYLELNK